MVDADSLPVSAVTDVPEGTPAPKATLPDVSVLPRVVLKKKRALPFFGRHPWVFAGAVHRVLGDPQPGAEVALVTDRGDFVARGLFNPDSNILVRLYSWDMEVSLDEEFWSRRLDEAISLRTQVLKFSSSTSPCRMVYSEADGLSGLVVDRYADWLLLQLTSRALADRKELIIRLLAEKLSPTGIWLRTEKGIRDAENLELVDGSLFGSEPARPLFVEENGLRFGIDLVEGQKTGFFLDQRDNRAAAARFAIGPRVLDAFCYTGGFALNLARRNDIKEVHAVDVSESALTLARANAEMNGLAQKVHFHKADAFKHLEALGESGEKFQTVVLDPPKLARHRKSLPDALRGYEHLNRMAVNLIPTNGILVTCSCTGHVTKQMFEEMLSQVAVSTGRRIQILEARGQAPDHPVSVHCLESDYLKCYVCRVV